MVWIYILELKDGKYYVGKTNNPDARILDHFKGGGSIWTKKYEPVKIIEKIPDCDDYDEDKYTKNIWIFMGLIMSEVVLILL